MVYKGLRGPKSFLFDSSTIKLASDESCGSEMRLILERASTLTSLVRPHFLVTLKGTGLYTSEASLLSWKMFRCHLFCRLLHPKICGICMESLDGSVCCSLYLSLWYEQSFVHVEA